MFDDSVNYYDLGKGCTVALQVMCSAKGFVALHVASESSFPHQGRPFQADKLNFSAS